MSQAPEPDDQDSILPIYSESVAIGRREIEKDTVRLTVRTKQREHPIEDLTQVRVEIERVPINRIVEEAPPMRKEGDITIIPVMEEIAVIERRLVLKEEIILRRVRHIEGHQESIMLRAQEAVIERTAHSGSEYASDDSIKSKKAGDHRND